MCEIINTSTNIETINFIEKFSNQILPLIGVLVGGGVTYFSTYILEKQREKRKFEILRIENTLIPFCDSLEKIIEEIESKTYKKIGFEQWFKNLKKSGQYLKSKHRFYLKKNLKNLLKNYIFKIEELEKLLEKESKVGVTNYRVWLGNKLEEYNPCLNVLMQFNSDVENIVKCKLLNKNNIHLSSKIKSIDFVYDDDPEKGCIQTIEINEETLNLYGVILYGEEDENSMDKNTLKLLNFLKKEIEPFEDNIMEEFKIKTFSLKKLNESLEILKEIKKDIHETIDKIME